MFKEFRLVSLVIEFIWNALQAYARTDTGAAELQAIETELTNAESDGTNTAENLVGLATSTLDQARAAVRAAKAQ